MHLTVVFQKDSLPTSKAVKGTTAGETVTRLTLLIEQETSLTRIDQIKMLTSCHRFSTSMRTEIVLGPEAELTASP